MTSPWMVVGPEFEIFTVRRVTATPMTRPERVKSKTMRRGEFVSTTPIQVRIRPDIEEIIAILLEMREEKNVGSHPFPIASAKHKALL